MLKIELVPALSHCIETVAKKEYEDILKQLLATAAANKELKEKVEILRLFLETADFKKLRAESEKYLVDGRHVKFVVYVEGGVPKYDMQISLEPQRSEKNLI